MQQVPKQMHCKVWHCAACCFSFQADEHPAAQCPISASTGVHRHSLGHLGPVQSDTWVACLSFVFSAHAATLAVVASSARKDQKHGKITASCEDASMEIQRLVVKGRIWKQHGEACLSKTSVLTEARCTDACCVSRTACVRLMQGRSSFLFTGNTSPSHVTTSSMVALLSAFTLCLHTDRALSSGH